MKRNQVQNENPNNDKLFWMLFISLAATVLILAVAKILNDVHLTM